ncbi:hypothetical protein EUGRSUZ_L02844 [Eucalyptus grandis]|uniref:Uncharacterized protein n=1 Tax=Eucalyptus grandis TaxID=71139 RepID=A0AAD9WIA5_EUCGR|nr:hypothetical protein EUGRSUZ_L02844 [Eucalyptus grandis]
MLKIMVQLVRHQIGLSIGHPISEHLTTLNHADCYRVVCQHIYRISLTGKSSTHTYFLIRVVYVRIARKHCKEFYFKPSAHPEAIIYCKIRDRGTRIHY